MIQTSTVQFKQAPQVPSVSQQIPFPFQENPPSQVQVSVAAGKGGLQQVYTVGQKTAPMFAHFGKIGMV